MPYLSRDPEIDKSKPGFLYLVLDPEASQSVKEIWTLLLPQPTYTAN